MSVVACCALRFNRSKNLAPQRTQARLHFARSSPRRRGPPARCSAANANRGTSCSTQCFRKSRVHAFGAYGPQVFVIIGAAREVPSDVFLITERRINQLIKAAAKRAKVNPEASAHWFRHAHASHAIDNGAPITLVSQTLGHADLKTTSVYAHARPNENSSRYLKSR